MKLSIPAQDTALYQSLPHECLSDIMRKLSAVDALRKVRGKKGIAGEVAKQQAAILGISVSRMRMLASDYDQRGWRALWNESRWPGSVLRTSLPPEFLQWWKYERVAKGVGGKTAKACYDRLVADWYSERRLRPAQTMFPGYDATPEPEPVTHLPAGWSESNLCDRKKLPSKAELALYREGVGQARKWGAMVLTDRKALEVGERLEVDDYHWNHRVIFQGQLVKVLQLGILDVRSGCVPSAFLKPAFVREDGVTDGIKQDHTLLLMASYLFRHGYLPGRTVFALEKGTAGLHAKHREAFGNFAPGLEFDDAGSRERHQLNGHAGKARTNANKKAHIESWHHLLTNIEAEGPACTGSNYTDMAEHVHGLLAETEWLLKKVQTQEEFELLKLGVLEFAKFAPWARGLIERTNERRNHELQGFENVLCFRDSLESLDWYSSRELLALPAAEKLAISDLVQQSPQLYTRSMKQSPAEVWREGREKLTRISGMEACHLAASVLGKGTMERVVRPRRLDRAYFQVSESRLAYLGEPVIFESRILTPDGTVKEIEAGRDVEIVFNPLDDGFPRSCFVRDERGGFMGIATEATRINPNDKEELLDALADRAVRDAERNANMREAFAPQRAQTKADKEHNRRVIAGLPVTAEQKRKAREKRVQTDAARKAIFDGPLNHTHHEPETTDTAAPQQISLADLR